MRDLPPRLTFTQQPFSRKNTDVINNIKNDCTQFRWANSRLLNFFFFLMAMLLVHYLLSNACLSTPRWEKWQQFSYFLSTSHSIALKKQGHFFFFVPKIVPTIPALLCSDWRSLVFQLGAESSLWGTRSFGQLSTKNQLFLLPTHSSFSATSDTSFFFFFYLWWVFFFF